MLQAPALDPATVEVRFRGIIEGWESPAAKMRPTKHEPDPELPEPGTVEPDEPVRTPDEEDGAEKQAG
ncbi:hypothetical protein [Nocardiopsis ansamitocini]|uniref:Uncharacterized protein n=1 Tax=Nocardiopsis ansamitocini TaxID=1670832 RepID=A0A9W6PA45_9ACTN|nr:hypothetical protein [Nocardiopsis ansamitocini]GLU49824.1 hypothetical protein Nans01_41750 [Nocardiopsis ansamitocini]